MPDPGHVALGSGMSTRQEDALRAARGLEAILIRQMLAAMERAQLEDGLFGRGPGTGTMATTFELLVSEALAEDAPLGLARQVVEQLAGDTAGRTAVEALAGSLPVTDLPVQARHGLNAYETMRQRDSSSSPVGRKDRWPPTHRPATEGDGGETR